MRHASGLAWALLISASAATAAPADLAPRPDPVPSLVDAPSVPAPGAIVLLVAAGLIGCPRRDRGPRQST